MAVRTWRASILVGLALMAPAEASAQSPGRVRTVIRQQYIALLNPMGMQHALEVAFRGRLGDPSELLFTGAHAEAGLVSYVSPVFAMHGGYVEVSPLAFLVARAEITENVVWPIGLEGAGYYGLQSYEGDARALAPELGGSASGWSFRASATLQGMIPLGPARLLVADTLIAQRASLGDASHYYDMKWDLILARDDWLFVNTGVLLVETDLERELHLRIGAYDDLRVVPASGYVGHQVGPIAMLSIGHPSPEVAEVTPFLRAGYYTHHVIRADELTILGGVEVSYDLGAIR